MSDEYSSSSEMQNFVLKAAARQRRFMAVFALAIFVASLALIALLPRVHEASATLTIDSLSNPLAGSIFAQEIPLPDQTVRDDTFGGRIRQMQSAGFRDAVLAALEPESEVVFDIPGSDGRGLRDQILFPLDARVYRVEIKRPKLTRFVRITVQGRGAERTAAIASQFADSLIDVSVAENLRPSRRLYGWLLDAVRSRSDQSGGEVDWDPAHDHSIAALSVVARDAEFRKLRDEKLATEEQLRAKRLIYFDDHPSVQKVQRALLSVESDMRSVTRRIVSNLLNVLNGKFRITNISVVEPAEPGEEPVFPNRWRMAAEALLLAAAAGFLAGLIRQGFDRTLRSAADLDPGLRKLCLYPEALSAEGAVELLMARGEAAAGKKLLVIESDPHFGFTALLAERTASSGAAALRFTGTLDKDPAPDVSWRDWTLLKGGELTRGRVTLAAPPPSDLTAPWQSAAGALERLADNAFLCVPVSGETPYPGLLSAASALGTAVLVLRVPAAANTRLLLEKARRLACAPSVTFHVLIVR